MFGFIKKLLGGGDKKIAPPRFPLPELLRRLGMSEAELRSIPISYTEFQIPKRTGGTRVLHAPNPQLKKLQRRILRRLLARLPAHPNATGFERGHSIVTNALPHVGRAVVIKLDLKEFFPSTTADRVKRYFLTIGWDDATADMLTGWCTHEKRLPQGAPTSPRLSNLLNQKLDARMAGIAQYFHASYTRYADDLTFSAEINDPAEPHRLNVLIHKVQSAVEDEGYSLHTARKLQIARKPDRQVVTGLVVNQKVNLPRSKRRWLRAVEHRLRTGREASITPEQLKGWQSLVAMIEKQSATK